MERRSLEAKDSDNSNYDFRIPQRCCWKLKPSELYELPDPEDEASVRLNLWNVSNSC